MTRKITIGGMSCGHCVKAVAGVLESLGLGVLSVSVGFAEVSGGAADADIRAAISDAGFEVIEIG